MTQLTPLRPRDAVAVARPRASGARRHHDPAPPPIVVVHQPRGGALVRAAGLARLSGATLHVVVHVPRRPPSPWVAWSDGARGASHDRAIAEASGLAVGGLHVEVHTASSRPRRLADDISRTLDGVVVA